MKHEMAGFFNKKLLKVAKRAGVIGHRRVVDSTGIADCVVTMDTITLITSAGWRCLELLSTLDGERESALRSSLSRSDYYEQTKPQTNWSQEDERHDLVTRSLLTQQRSSRRVHHLKIPSSMRLSRCFALLLDKI